MALEQTETEIQNLILEFLHSVHIEAWRNAINYRGRIKSGLCPGSSDIIGIYQGRFLAIEVKKPKKGPTKDQQDFIDTVNKAGGVAFVAHSIDEVRSKLVESVVRH